jgi:hypothetical protein
VVGIEHHIAGDSCRQVLVNSVKLLYGRVHSSSPPSGGGQQDSVALLEIPRDSEEVKLIFETSQEFAGTWKASKQTIQVDAKTWPSHCHWPSLRMKPGGREAVLCRTTNNFFTLELSLLFLSMS